MKKVMQAELCDKGRKIYANIELPAIFEQMEDCLEKIHSTSEDSKVISAECLMEYDLLAEKELDPCSLCELNYFTVLVENLDEVDQQRFEALTAITCKNDTVTVSELINLAMNLNEIDMYYIPVLNDKELGDFYIDNEFVPQLDNLPTEKADWLLSHIDCEKVGKEMREQENGIYCGRGYAVVNEEPKQLYNGNFPVPQPKDYVFRLEIAKPPIGDIANDEHTVTLTLPANDTDIITAVKKAVASTPQECVFYEYESTIPQLEEVFYDMSDLYTLNELARKIETMKACGDIPKYKAMLCTLDKFNLQTALEVTEYLSEFTLECGCETPAEYGVQKDISYTLTTSDVHAIYKPQPYQNVVGALCHRDYKGVNSIYVNQDKCIVDKPYQDTSTIRYIVIHYTGNDGDRAASNGRYFKERIVNASAHYFVDDTEIIQSVPDHGIAWSVGGNKYPSCSKTGGGQCYGKCINHNSISIELCDTEKNGASDFSEATLANAAKLCQMLMKKYNVPSENVIRHFDVVGKICPKPFVENKVAWKKWKERLVDNEMVDQVKIMIDGKTYEVNRILKDGTNYVKIRDIADAVGYDITSNGNVPVLRKK